MSISCPVPLMGICAYSGTGKTTLLERLIPLLKAQGLRLALLKHAHHNFDIDQPGKDSYQLRKAGADQVLVASRQRIALIKERHLGEEEPRLGELLRHLDYGELDLLLVEGFKREPIPKIELYRPSLGTPQIHPQDQNVIAVATDQAFPTARGLPLLDLNQPEEIAAYVIDWLKRQASPKASA